MTMPMLGLLFAALVGIFSGTHAAIWGMYKDAPHEGFVLRNFMRSIIIGGVAALFIQSVIHLELPSVAGFVVLFGLAYGVERSLVETWKTFVRVEDQSKYFIPMQFSIGGVPVNSRAARLAFGMAYVAAAMACLTAVARLDAFRGSMPAMLGAAVTGLVVGGILALGGCWKDAPKEGFDPLKFWRSPLIALIYAFLLEPLTTSYVILAIAVIGYERGTAETYKTFFGPRKPPGKFAGKPILHPDMLDRRQRVVPAYFMISGGALMGLAVALGR